MIDAPLMEIALKDPVKHWLMVGPALPVAWRSHVITLESVAFGQPGLLTVKVNVPEPLLVVGVRTQLSSVLAPDKEADPEDGVHDHE